MNSSGFSSKAKLLILIKLLRTSLILFLKQKNGNSLEIKTHFFLKKNVLYIHIHIYIYIYIYIYP